MYEELMAQLLQHEGLRLKPYKCTAGKLTIGIGRNLDDVGITEDEAFSMLRNDVMRVVKEVSVAFPVIESLDSVRADVIYNMAFNLGISRLRGFKKMWKAIEAQDWEEASVQMLDSKWARQVGKRSTDLAQQMVTGEYVYAG